MNHRLSSPHYSPDPFDSGNSFGNVNSSANTTSSSDSSNQTLQLTMPEWSLRPSLRAYRAVRSSFINKLKLPAGQQDSIQTTEQQQPATTIALFSREILQLNIPLPFTPDLSSSSTDNSKQAVNSTGWLGVDGSCDITSDACSLTFFLKQTELPTWSAPGLEISWLHQLSWVTALQNNTPVAHQAQITLMNLDFKQNDQDKQHVEWAIGQAAIDPTLSSISLSTQLELHQDDVYSFTLGGGVNLKKDSSSGRWGFDSAAITLTFAPAHWIQP